ncbi:MAG: GNAT family N-acetyltransferase [Bdellovibrio sp.]|nr:GNAT family N-acetyltransferase [Bdellovibrio sp.]
MKTYAMDQAEKRSEVCNRILRALPKWFGLEYAIVNYVDEVKTMDTWFAEEAGQVVGFISIRKHNTFTAEIHVMGILESFHRQGVGSKLVQAAQKSLAASGFKYLQVKTLSENRADRNYDKTRRFYLSDGFTPIEEFKTLWDEFNPCLMLIKEIQRKSEMTISKVKFPDYTFNGELREVPKNREDLDYFIEDLSKRLATETNQEDRRYLLENLGTACRIDGRLADAETYFLKALNLSIAVDISAMIRNQIRLAHVYQWQKEFEKAHAMMAQAKALANENKMSESLRAAFHQHKAKIYFDQGFYGLAVCEFELALKIRTNSMAPIDQLESTRLSLAESKKRWAIQLADKITIRVAQVTDAEAIHQAHMISIKEICSKDHSPEEIRVWGGRKYNPDFRLPGILNQFYLVVEHQGQIEGFCQLRVEYKDHLKSAYLFGFYITPKVLKKKIGHALINLVFEFCESEKMNIINLKSTITSLNFYEKYGFQKISELEGKPRDGVTVWGYPMTKAL